jgi:hypothetical protein
MLEAPCRSYTQVLLPTLGNDPAACDLASPSDIVRLFPELPLGSPVSRIIAFPAPLGVIDGSLCHSARLVRLCLTVDLRRWPMVSQ